MPITQTNSIGVSCLVCSFAVSTQALFFSISLDTGKGKQWTQTTPPTGDLPFLVLSWLGEWQKMFNKVLHKTFLLGYTW